MAGIKYLMKKHIGLFCALALLLVLVFSCLAVSLYKTGARFIYIVDDAYIHMALAKNFAQYGVWGVTKYEYNSLSSSLIWPLVLAGAYKIFGFHEIFSLILSVSSAVALISLFYFILRRYTSDLWIITASLILFILYIPVVPSVFTGLEHTLHAFLSVLFMYLSSVILSRDNVKIKDCLSIFVIAPILLSTRYEAIFLISTTAFLLMLRRQWKAAICLAVSGFIPVSAYGLISLAKGWYFFPNSVIIKGNMPQFSSLSAIIDSLGYGAVKNIVNQPYFYMLIILNLFFLFRMIKKYNSVWKIEAVMPIIFIAVMLMHLQFADTDSFTRYEVYFFSMGFTSLAVMVLNNISTMKMPRLDKSNILRFIVAAILVIFIFVPFEWRGRVYLMNIPTASSNIYHQQIQMSKFINKYFNGFCVALNDIGAVNCFADIKCVDLYGLADMEVAKAKLNGYYKTPVISSIVSAKDAKIAVVYDSWYYNYGGIPPQWIKKGNWSIKDNVVCASDTVTFYAIDPAYKDYLSNALAEFSKKFPAEIKYVIY